MKTALSACVAAAALIAAASPAQAADRPAIRLNQAGYEAGGRIGMTIAADDAAPLRWRVTDGAGTVRAEGLTRPFGADAASGERVHQVRIDALPAGDYSVAVDGRRRAFRVAPRPFATLKRDALAYFYQNRAGVPILARHVERPDLARAAGHPEEVVTCFSGRDQRGADWPGCDYRLNVTGGWYDAGDHGKYVVNGGIAVWTLVDAYERGRRRDLAPFADGAADIPEAGDGVDDLLNEARYELEFLLAMQIPDGARTAVLADGAPRVIDAGGLVHHKVADRAWTALPMAPAADPQPRLLYPPSTAATLNLAAVAGQCARVWRDVDPAFADRCLTAARRAYAAAKARPGLLADNRFDGSGAYGDDQVADEFYWAAAELWAATGEAAYAADARASAYWLGAPGVGASSTGDISWGQVGALGTIALASAPALPEAERRAARDALTAAACAYLAEGETQGYALPRGGDRFEWGSNGALMNRAMILGLAHDFTGDPAFRQGVVDSLDYLLGRNPLDQSYVSGWGERPMRHPHHRFWAAGYGPGWPEPPAGALSGGPNNTAMSDDIARPMRGHCAPLACWADHIDAYALNEVAINWNAPLVWVAAFVDPDPVPAEAQTASAAQ
ncbi:glycoside hydrolase family 9 protein [uncultured Brevundimonas sp.]|uniref:glycoside hydrolase family 9 protein n=1 Tax=uncultured Brevundimonas sp. TaxID=213418 RepID=UPI002591F0E1|nr:glycoside hydrolase family 9 protein [uncultured Brevundimonas sp.]